MKKNLKLRMLKKYPLNYMLKAMFLLCLFAGVASYANAQQVLPLTDLQTQLQTNNQDESQQFNHLLNDIVPAAYINIKGTRVFPENTTQVQVIHTTPDFLASVYTPQEELKSAELLEIRLTKEADFAQSLDVAQLSVFNQLKYVYILSEIDCDIAQVAEQMLTGTNTQITVFYAISIPR